MTRRRGSLVHFQELERRVLLSSVTFFAASGTYGVDGASDSSVQTQEYDNFTYTNNNSPADSAGPGSTSSSTASIGGASGTASATVSTVATASSLQITGTVQGDSTSSLPPGPDAEDWYATISADSTLGAEQYSYNAITVTTTTQFHVVGSVNVSAAAANPSDSTADFNTASASFSLYDENGLDVLNSNALQPALTASTTVGNTGNVTQDTVNQTVTLQPGQYYISLRLPIGTNADGNAQYTGGAPILEGDSSGTASATASITITAQESVGAAAQLAFDPTQEPGDTTVAYQTGSGAIANTVAVDVLDANGNLVASDNSTVTLSLNALGGLSLGGTTSAAAVNGVATFSGLLINAGGVDGGDGTLHAADAGLTPATSSTFTVTTLLDLAKLSNDAYSASPAGSTAGSFSFLESAEPDPQNLGFAAAAFANASRSQIVVAIRGTVASASSPLQTIKNLAADVSFGGSTPSPLLESEVQDAASFVAEMAINNTGSHVTLTGHSLGGALAQLIAKASGLPAYTFNSPGAKQLYTSLATNLQAVSGLSSGGANVNYRLDGDQVSLMGTPIGTQVIMAAPSGTSFSSLVSPALNAVANLGTFLNLHFITTFIAQIQSNAPVLTGDQAVGPDDAAALEDYIQPTLTNINGAALYAFTFGVTSLGGMLLDPSSGSDFVLTEQAGSPNIGAIALPVLSNVASYEVQSETGSTWSGFTQVQPGVKETFGAGVDGVEFYPQNSGGQGISLTDSFLFDASFDSTGTFTGSLSESDVPGSSFATLIGGALTVNGTAGDDTIALTTAGATLNVTLNGVPATPIPLSSITSITVNGQAGNDTITLGAGVPGCSVQGGPGDDTISGGPGNDTLGGGLGNDFILGAAGDDLIHGGAGDDSIGGGQGNDDLFGGLGNDTMTGGAGNDTLIGGAGTNVMHGGPGDDTLFAINGQPDTLYGGTGNDTAHIDQGLDQIPNNDIETVLFT